VVGSIVAAAIGIGLCPWRHRHVVLAFRARSPGRRNLAENPLESVPARQEDEPTGTTDSEVVPMEDSRDRDLGAQPTTMAF
jgi:hypothetical protein